jgi:hypothetical protein
MAARKHPNREYSARTGVDVSPTTAAEDTPLLYSRGSNSRSSSPQTSAGSSETYRGTGIDATEEDDGSDVPNQRVTKKRAAAIMLSVYILIFLLGIGLFHCHPMLLIYHIRVDLKGVLF